MFGRRQVAMLVAEFMGTAMLALAVYSMVARTSFPLFAGLAAGGTLGLVAITMGSVSGGYLNPAVTFGMWTVRKIKTVQALLFVAAQMLGGVAAWQLIKYYLNRKVESVAGAKFDWRVFIAEAVGTLVFSMGVAAAVHHKDQGGKLSFVLGGSLLIGILIASLGSNGVLNPAVAIGIQSWSWAYAVAPFAGALVGFNVYTLLFTSLPEAKATRAARTTRVTRSTRGKKRR